MNQQSQDISLKDVILFTKEFFVEIRRFWWIVLMFIILIFAYYYISEQMTPMKYQATTKYIVNEDNNAGGMGGVLGQLGFRGGSSENKERILQIASSRNLLEKTIFTKTLYNGDTTYIGNEIIEVYDLNEIWSANDPSRLDYRLSVDNSKDLDRLGKSVLKIIHSKITTGAGEDPIMVNSVDKQTGILSMDITSENESLSLKLSDLLYENLKSFYDEKTTSKQKTTLQVLKTKRDSVETLLETTVFSLARFKDRNNSIIYQTDKVQEQRLSQEAAKLRVVLTGLAQNEELADFQLKNKRPFFEVIEDPIIPLRRIYMTKARMIQYALILGVFFSFLLILGRMLYRKALS